MPQPESAVDLHHYRQSIDSVEKCAGAQGKVSKAEKELPSISAPNAEKHFYGMRLIHPFVLKEACLDRSGTDDRWAYYLRQNHPSVFVVDWYLPSSLLCPLRGWDYGYGSLSPVLRCGAIVFARTQRAQRSLKTGSDKCSISCVLFTLAYSF